MMLFVFFIGAWFGMFVAALMFMAGRDDDNN